MSRFFVQLLLSLLVGVGAAVGFRPDVRGEVNKTLREAKGFIAETDEAALETAADVSTRVEADVSVSAEADSSVSAEDELEVEADAQADVDVDAEVDRGRPLRNNSSPEVSLDGSLEANSEMGVEVEAGELELELENETESSLGLELEK